MVKGAQARLLELLDNAIALDRATKGNIQVYDPNKKRLILTAELQRGFEAPFLEHFASVKAFDSSACGRAMGTGNCVLIPDVMSDVAFEAHRKVALAAGVRSVKSMPLVGADGVFRGILSTHAPGVKWDWERDNTRHIAAAVAKILAEGGRGD